MRYIYIAFLIFFCINLNAQDGNYNSIVYSGEIKKIYQTAITTAIVTKDYNINRVFLIRDKDKIFDIQLDQEILEVFISDLYDRLVIVSYERVKEYANKTSVNLFNINTGESIAKIIEYLNEFEDQGVDYFYRLSPKGRYLLIDHYPKFTITDLIDGSKIKREISGRLNTTWLDEENIIYLERNYIDNQEFLDLKKNKAEEYDNYSKEHAKLYIDYKKGLISEEKFKEKSEILRKNYNVNLIDKKPSKRRYSINNIPKKIELSAFIKKYNISQNIIVAQKELTTQDADNFTISKDEHNSYTMFVDSDYSIYIYGYKLSFEKKRSPVLIKLNKKFELLSDIMLENYAKPKIIELYNQIYHQFKNLETKEIYYLDKQKLNLTEKKSFNEDFLKIISTKKIDRLKRKDILFNTLENKILY